MPKRTPVFTDDPGWHGRRLQDAFANRGLEAVFISLKDCYFDLSSANPSVVIPSFDYLPKAVFVRGVPGGTLQQVIARLDILHALKMLGVNVYNDANAIERTVDKAMTSFMLHHHGIATPKTWVCESRAIAQDIINKQASKHTPLVLKPLFGSQGQGVRKVDAETPFPVPMEAYVDGLYYLQEYIDSGEGAWHDYRAFVINQQVVGVMKRHGATWINNVAQGGRCELASGHKIIESLALRAAEVLSIDYCGIDIIQDKNQQFYVLEVNSIPAWKGLQTVTNINVAQALVDDIIAKTYN